MSEPQANLIPERSTHSTQPGFRKRSSQYPADDGAVKKVEAFELEVDRETPPDKPENLLDDLPPWQDQITLRGLVIGAGLGAVFCIVVHKLMLTAGLFPTFNTSAGLLSFIFLKAWSWVTTMLKLPGSILRAQETTVVQTFVIACCNLAFSGGFALQLGALSNSTYALMNTPTHLKGDSIADTAEPTLSLTIPLLLCVSIIGVFTVVFFRKLFIVDYQLPFPSGAATGYLINGFFTSGGEATAKKQMSQLTRWLTISFSWGLFKWFFAGSSCAPCKSGVCGGFSKFPTFGLAALTWKWNFDFQINLIGTGMICSHAVNWSIMLGAIISWGVLWPIVNDKAGDWYPIGTDPSSMQGLYGYKIFITLSIFMSDGLYSICKVLLMSALHMNKKHAELKAARLAAHEASQQEPEVRAVIEVHGSALEEEEEEAKGNDEYQQVKETASQKKQRTHVFLSDHFPWWFSVAGYACLAALGTGVIPTLYPAIKWYQVLVAYMLAVLLALPNTYGDGLTDWDMASMYGKLAILLFSAWSGPEGGVTAGLISCSVILVAVSTAAHLMQDFRTGYVTLTSPKAMFISQVVGALMGVFLAPLTFQLFWKTGEVGNPDGAYPSPLSQVYRAMAVVGSQGLSGTMPPKCGSLVLIFFFITLALNIARDVAPPKYRRFMPVPMAIGIPFYLGAYLAVDMCIGSVANLLWAYFDPVGQETLSMAVAAGLLVGDGVWTVPSSILAMANIRPPVCMSFAAQTWKKP